MLSEKILVIDDDARIVRSLRVALEGYEVIDFSNGEDGLAYMRKPNTVSIVLLDIMMPCIDGMSVLEEIKRNNKGVTVIMMTAYGSKDVAIQALRCHADDFLEKPFDVVELKEKIQIILKEKSYGDKYSGSRDDNVSRIKRFIERNHKNASLDFIANEMCLSPKYVSRMFNKSSGSSFRDFKVNVKMNKAKELLDNSSFNVSEIAFQLGYQNPESFMRIFKRMMKLTPLEYRNKKQRPKRSKEKVVTK